MGMLWNGPNYSSFMLTACLALHFIVPYLTSYEVTTFLNLSFWLRAEAMRTNCCLHSDFKSPALLCRLCNLCSALFYTVCIVFIADFFSEKLRRAYISHISISRRISNMLSFPCCQRWEEFTTSMHIYTSMYINTFLHIVDAETSYWFLHLIRQKNRWKNLCIVKEIKTFFFMLYMLAAVI